MYRSPAKVNLVLKVFGKQEDGYHQIASLMQAISFFDEIFIEPHSKDLFSCSHPDLLMDEQNLCIRALTLFRVHSGILQPIRLHLEKKIPLGAGLGGGSSNAATILFALDQIFKTQLPLIQLSQQLGCDVPFFFSKGFAFVYNRGEKMIPLVQTKKIKLHLSFPKCMTLTKDVYARFEKSQNNLNAFEILSSYFEDKADFFNDLEKPALNLQNQLVKHRQYLLSCGFSRVLLTGSGSTFMIFDDCPLEIRKRLDLLEVSAAERDLLNWY